MSLQIIDGQSTLQSLKSGTSGSDIVPYHRIDLIDAGSSVDIGTIADAAVVSDSNGSLSAKLRGLVKMFADVWDSANHWFRVSDSQVHADLAALTTKFPTSVGVGGGLKIEGTSSGLSIPTSESGALLTSFLAALNSNGMLQVVVNSSSGSPINFNGNSGIFPASSSGEFSYISPLAAGDTLIATPKVLIPVPPTGQTNRITQLVIQAQGVTTAGWIEFTDSSNVLIAQAWLAIGATSLTFRWSPPRKTTLNSSLSFKASAALGGTVNIDINGYAQ